MDQPPCRKPPVVSSSGPPGAWTTPSRLMKSLRMIRMPVGPCRLRELIASRGSALPQAFLEIDDREPVLPAGAGLAVAGRGVEPARGGLQDGRVGVQLPDAQLPGAGLERLEQGAAEPAALERRRDSHALDLGHPPRHPPQSAHGDDL